MVLHSWHDFARRSHVAKTRRAKLYPADAFLISRRYVWRHGFALCRSVLLHNLIPIKNGSSPLCWLCRRANWIERRGSADSTCALPSFVPTSATATYR